MDARQLIEYAGRVCWRSEPNGDTDGFIDRLIRKGHTSVLEHAAVSIVPAGNGTRHVYDTDGDVHDSSVANLRTLLEVMMHDAGGYTNDVRDEFRIKALDAELSEHRAVFEIVCDRAVSHELVRHRSMSFTQESQRYVNSVKKDGELPVVESKKTMEQFGWMVRVVYRIATYVCWVAYSIAIFFKVQPQIARMILPNMTRTKVIMSGYMWEWVWFIKLRCDKAAHPDMRIIAEMIKDQLYSYKNLRGWLEVAEYNERLKYYQETVVLPG